MENIKSAPHCRDASMYPAKNKETLTRLMEN